mgnify:CR=1 FL=1
MQGPTVVPGGGESKVGLESEVLLLGCEEVDFLQDAD